MTMMVVGAGLDEGRAGKGWTSARGPETESISSVADGSATVGSLIVIILMLKLLKRNVHVIYGRG